MRFAMLAGAIYAGAVEDYINAKFTPGERLQ